MASVGAVKTSECEDFVKRERIPTPEAMDTNNNNNLDFTGGPATTEITDKASAAGGNVLASQAQQSRATARSARHSFPSVHHHPQQQAHFLQHGPVTGNTAAAAGRQTSAEFSGRRTSGDILRSLISPEFPSQTGTPTSLSQLIPSGFSSSEGNEFATPMGSGRLSPQMTDRMTRKRALSVSPLSSSSLDLNSLIRTSPTSLVNYIANSRGSSAGSFGHLSPSQALFGNMHQQTHARPMQVSLRSGNYPVANTVSSTHHSFNSQSSGDYATEHDDSVTVKKEMEMSPPVSQHCSNGNSSQDTDTMKMEDIRNSLFNGCNISVKMEPDSHDNSFFPPPLIPLSGGGLETVQEEPGGMLMSDDEDFLHSDPTDYSAMMNSNECEYESKLGIIESTGDPDRQKRIYYSYPSVEEPHNNQCRWAECSVQCEDLDGLVQHVNSDHIYRDSKKEFVCNWLGCVRERKPFKAQYMLLVHMRRHTGEKPHKCTYKGCFKAYSRLENLKTHLRSHTGERPYVCKHEGCGKAFSNASDCAKHMNRTHSDEKPYACPNPGCIKRYTDPSSRRKHMKNCQINKKVCCKDNPDALSGADEESCAESAPPKPSTSAAKKTKPKKMQEKRKSAPSISNPAMKGGLSGDHGYDTGGSQPGYVSGGSQGYTSSQLGYNSSGYDESEYCFQEDEISRMRLSDPTDMAGRGNAGHMTSGRNGQSAVSNHSHMMTHQGSYHFQSPPFHPSPLSPSQHFMPPPLVPTTSSRQLPGEMAGHHTVDFTAPMRSRQNRTPCSSGYSSFRSSEKSPDDIDTSSIISSSIRTLSTFSSNSSRVSTPCSGSDRTTSLFPVANQILAGHRGGELESPASYGQHKLSLQMNNTYPPTGNSHVRRHSDEISNSSRGWTCSSQGSHYSYSGSELSDDLLDSLPTEVRKNGFSKSEPLPLPESMQHNFSASGMGMEFRDQGMEFSQSFMEHPSSTMPLRHYDNASAFSSSQHSHDGVYSQDSSHLSGGGERYESYVNMVHHMSSPGSSIVSPSNNMVMGNMETFTHTLSEETQYYENMYQGHVNA